MHYMCKIIHGYLVVYKYHTANDSDRRCLYVTHLPGSVKTLNSSSDSVKGELTGHCCTSEDHSEDHSGE